MIGRPAPSMFDAEDFDQAAASVEDEDTPPESTPMTVPQAGPRVLYIDLDDDLPTVLDRVEDGPAPAIVVFPDGARAVRGIVAARLLKRRAEAAGIELAAVTTDRTTIAQLQGVGIPCAQTVGEARRLLEPGNSAPQVSIPSVSQWIAAAHPPAPAVLPPAAQPSNVPPAQHTGNTEPDDSQDKTLHAPTPTAGRHGPGRWLIAVFALLLLVIAGAGVKLLFFPDVSITISYAQQRFNHTYRLAAGDMAAAGIPLHHTHISTSAQISVAGSGTTFVPYGHATGTVTFANQANGYVRVPAGTILTALNGARYATTVEIRVPAAVHNFAGTTNGQQSVDVRALQAGTEANVPANSIGAIVGRLAGVLLVTNYDAIAGGSVRTIYVVTSADIVSATQKLARTLTGQERRTLLYRYAKSPTRLLGHTTLSVPRMTRLDRNGHPYATITLSARTDLTYVHERDIQRYALKMRSKQLAGHNQRVVHGSEMIRITHAVTGGETIAVQVQDRTQPTIDIANLRALLSGKSIADGRALLDGSARNGDWRYNLRITPDWALQFPQAANLIAITIVRSR